MILLISIFLRVSNDNSFCELIDNQRFILVRASFRLQPNRYQLLTKKGLDWYNV